MNQNSPFAQKNNFFSDIGTIRVKLVALSLLFFFGIVVMFFVNTHTSNELGRKIDELYRHATLQRNYSVMNTMQEAINSDALELLRDVENATLSPQNYNKHLADFNQHKLAFYNTQRENRSFVKTNSELDQAFHASEPLYANYINSVESLFVLAQQFYSAKTEEAQQRVVASQSDERTLRLATALDTSNNTQKSTASIRADIVTRYTKEVNPQFEKLKTTGNTIVAKIDKIATSLKASAAQSREEAQTINLWAIGAILIILMFLVLSFAKKLDKNMKKVLSQIEAIKSGDYSHQVDFSNNQKDEVAIIGSAINQMSAQVSALYKKAKDENDDLNASIIELLGAVHSISQKDLTTKIAVKENMVGSVADAINYLANSTLKAITNTSAIAKLVTAASEETKVEATNVVSLSDKQSAVVQKALSDFKASLEEITKMSCLASESKLAADMVTKSTTDTLLIVGQTVSSMKSIQTTISQAESKIKSLAERSQEIGTIVGLINSISERTHVLALNATIQAAIAGDAGRGFAAVAEEVQKLAENTREATSKISSLIQNIQNETQQTISIVNKTIDSVVSGSQLAEATGAQMRATNDTTARLVEFVQTIASSIEGQKITTTNMLSEATQLGDSSKAVSASAKDQLMRARSLVQFASKLQETVSEFKITPSIPQDTPLAIEEAQLTPSIEGNSSSVPSQLNTAFPLANPGSDSIIEPSEHNELGPRSFEKADPSPEESVLKPISISASR